MKKSLSLLVAFALVFGLFASMAAAADADLTTAQKYQQLVDSKVLKGTTSGDPMLDANLTRAEFATIAVAIAGLTEDTSASAFADVKVGQWWTGAIQAAYNAGLVNGVGGGLFSPKANVTVQEAIKVADGIAGLTPVADATVEGAAAWAGPYIQAALDAGLPIPSNYTAAATRGQTIDLAYAVYLAKQVKPLSDVKAVVNSDDTITVTGTTAGGVDGVKVALGTADAVAATLNTDGTFTYTTAKQVAGDYTLTVTAYAGTTSVKSETVSASVDGFKVDSVTVLNGKQIAVKLNKAVQEGTSAGGASFGVGTGSTNDAYFLLAGVEPSNVSVSSDKMTVTLTFNPNFTAQKDAYVQFEVNGALKSASGKTNPGYKQAILLSDSTAPTVTGTTFSGTVATLAFSEPVSSVGTVSVNGAEIGTAVSTTAPYYTLVTDGVAGGNYGSIQINGLSGGTSYNVYIVAGQDIFGNYFDYNGTVAVPNDTTAPSISSVTVSGATLTVHFTETLSEQGYAKLSGETDLHGTFDTNDHSIVYFDLSGWLHGATFRNVAVTISGYKDLMTPTANTGADSAQSVTIGLDQGNPQFQAVSTDGKYFVFKFNEKLATTVFSAISYKYTNTDGVVSYGSYPITSASVGYDANNNNGGTTNANDSDEWNYLLVDSGSTAVPAGKYEFTLAGSTVKDVATPTANGNDAASPVITVSGSGASGGLVLQNVYTSTNPGTAPFNNLSNTQFILQFNKDLAASAVDVSKYTINGSALPTGSTATFYYDKQHVLVEIPVGSIQATGSRTVAVTGLTANDGDTLSTTASDYSKMPVLNENVKPVAQSVALSSDSQISVTFSETLGTGVTPSGIEVWINGVKYTGTQSYTYSNNVLNIIAAGGTFNATQSIQVKFSGSNVQDVKGNTVADVTVTK